MAFKLRNIIYRCQYDGEEKANQDIIWSPLELIWICLRLINQKQSNSPAKNVKGKEKEAVQSWCQWKIPKFQKWNRKQDLSICGVKFKQLPVGKSIPDMARSLGLKSTQGVKNFVFRKSRELKLTFLPKARTLKSAFPTVEGGCISKLHMPKINPQSSFSLSSGYKNLNSGWSG